MLFHGGSVSFDYDLVFDGAGVQHKTSLQLKMNNLLFYILPSTNRPPCTSFYNTTDVNDEYAN